MSRAIRLQEAARLNGMARELMHRWSFEDQQAMLKGRSHCDDATKVDSKNHRTFADELLAEARSLDKEADEIYKGLRG